MGETWLEVIQELWLVGWLINTKLFLDEAIPVTHASNIDHQDLLD